MQRFKSASSLVRRYVSSRGLNSPCKRSLCSVSNNPLISDSEDAVLVEGNAASRTAILNRPSALNGLNLSTGKMVYSNGLVEKLSIKKKEPIQVLSAGKTPSGLYFLSNLDQTYPFLMEIVFSFKGNGQSNATEVIKTALAKVLVEFYPLAGCLTTTWDGKMMVRCTGEGVPFVEAFSENNLEILEDISKIDTAKLRKLVHFNKKSRGILDVPPLTVQVTTFKCGGVVVGVGLNHVLVDGIAFIDFMNSWSEVARGMSLSVHPYLDRSVLSPRQPPLVDMSHDEYIKPEQRRDPISYPHKGKLINKSFSFDAHKLSRLRKVAMVGNTLTTPPTSFELISALVWTNWTKAFKIKPERTTKLLTAVDSRRKLMPPMPEGYFGNGIVLSRAQCKAKELAEKPFSFAVKIVNEAIKAVTDDYIKSAVDHYELNRQQPEFQNTLWITKWSRLPFYDINFGWGEPKQVAPASLVYNLFLSLSQGKDSENLVVSLSLPALVMESFEELMLAEVE